MNAVYRKHFRKALPILASFLAGICLVALLIKTHDPLASYFSSETLAYITLDADSEFLSSYWYRQAITTGQPGDGVIDQTFQKLDKTDGRNLAAGFSIVDGSPKILVVGRFPESVDLSPVKEYLVQHNLAVIEVGRPATSMKLLFVSNDAAFAEMAIENSKKSSVSQINLSSFIWLNHPGTARINLHQLSGRFPGAADNQAPLKNWLTFGLSFSKIAGNVIISNTPLVNRSSMPVISGTALKTVFSLSGDQNNEPGQLARQLLQSIISADSDYGLEQLITDSQLREIDYIENSQPDSTSLLLSWPGLPQSAETFQSQAAGIIQNYLSVKNQRSQTVYLPDGSPIQTMVKNTKSISIRGADQSVYIDDLESLDKFELSRRNDTVTISKNYEPIVENTAVIDGCPLGLEDDFIIFNLNKWFFPDAQFNLGKVLILESKAESSTSYPHFSFCLY